MNQTVIETQGVTRRFGRLTVVDHLDLQVPRDSIYGFLGPNGAGKTTSIRMILGLIRPDEGSIRVLGRPLQSNRKSILSKVGALVEVPSLYPHLSGYENLLVIQTLVNGKKADIERVLKIVDMQGSAHRLVREYSLGMRQRLALAMAMLNMPQLLILDEPGNGLDPAGIYELRELIKSLPEKEGMTIFISSHLLAEVEAMATHVGIIQQGKMVFQGTPQQLRASYNHVLNLATNRNLDAQLYLSQLGWSVENRENDSIHILVNDQGDVAQINHQLVQAGFQIYQLNLSQPSLEDIFLMLTEKPIQQEV
jgi:lantibiotic transport system ATP-binding protein